MTPEFHLKGDGYLPGFPNQSAVLSGVLKVTNEVTSGEFWSLSAAVSRWDCSASHRDRQLLNRLYGLTPVPRVRIPPSPPEL
jgi:hypothetical protein